MNDRLEVADGTEAIADESCVHRWLLVSPEGNSVQGTCRICGAQRAFTDRRRTAWIRRVPRGPTG
jgi:hypothetical protein